MTRILETWRIDTESWSWRIVPPLISRSMFYRTIQIDGWSLQHTTYDVRLSRLLLASMVLSCRGLGTAFVRSFISALKKKGGHIWKLSHQFSLFIHILSSSLFCQLHTLLLQVRESACFLVLCLLSVLFSIQMCYLTRQKLCSNQTNKACPSDRFFRCGRFYKLQSKAQRGDLHAAYLLKLHERSE